MNMAERESLGPLFQTWVKVGYSDGSAVYKSRGSFKKSRPGVEFRKDGTIIKRQNLSFCGTPPIKYENASGNWSFTSDSLLILQYENWRGFIKDTFEMTHLSKKRLELRRAY